MAYLSLYRKYRPQTFDEILGQEHVSRTLSNAIVEDRVAHAYLFTGPRGTGKTSTARILAKALNCAEGPTPSPCGKCDSCRAITEGSSLDVIELDAASHSKVDETRDVLAGVPLATAGGRRKVYVIDEVHMLTAGSFNALLKTLEEPPAHVLFILATTEAHKVLQTIVSRTQRFDFRRVPIDVLEGLLAGIAEREEIDVDPGALAVIARHADGGARDALSVLDQIASLDGHVAAHEVERLLGERTEDAFLDVFDALAAGDVGAIFWTVHTLMAQGADPRQLAVGALEHARSLLLLKTAPDGEGLLDLSPEHRARLTTQTEAFTAGGLLRTVDLLGKAITEMRNAPGHRLWLEVALVRAAVPETDPSAAGVLGRLERLERRSGIDSGPSAAEGPSAAAPLPAEQQSAPIPQPAAGPARPAERFPAARAATAPARQTPAPEPAPPPVAAGEKAGAAAEPAAPPSAPPGSIGFGHVKDSWTATLAEVSKRSKRVWGFLNPSRPVRFDDDTLLIEVQSEFHESQMTRESNSRILAEALHAALGLEATLAFAARGTERTAGLAEQSSEATPAPTADDDVTDYADARAVDTDADPIELVKRGLGAEVVEESADRKAGRRS